MTETVHAESWRMSLTLGAGAILAIQLLWQPLTFLVPYHSWISMGMMYMATFFHELGHTSFHWIFGYPGLPSFDFEHGGGIAWHFGRQPILQWMMIVAGAVGVYITWRWSLTLGIAVAALYVALVAASLTGFHDVIINYMGHGAESLVGAYIVARVLMDGVPNRPFEYEVHALAGPYLLLSPVHLSWGLATDQAVRDVYWQQKGTEGFGDFSRIADYFMLPNEVPVAWFCMGLSVIIAAAPFVVKFFWERF